MAQMQPVFSVQTACMPKDEDRIDLQRLVAVGRLVTVEHLNAVESTMHRARVLAELPGRPACLDW